MQPSEIPQGWPLHEVVFTHRSGSVSENWTGQSLLCSSKGNGAFRAPQPSGTKVTWLLSGTTSRHKSVSQVS